MAKREKVDGIPTIPMPEVDDLEVIRGAAGCGKTQRLIDTIRELIARGDDPSSILVVSATPDAASAFRTRLGVPQVRVTYARELALELLAEPDAVALFGHGPRVLLPFEEDILFEDLKMCDVEVGRMRGMLAFFERSMTEISDDHPDFLMDDDEQAVMGLLRDGLDLRGAILEFQVSADAARYLKHRGAGGRYAHVIVDDVQGLCRASQAMAALLTTSSLHVATDPESQDPIYEPFPYADGVNELLDANPGVTIIELSALHVSMAVSRASNGMRAEAGLAPCTIDSATEGSCLVEVLGQADDETERLADIVAAAVQGGIAIGDVFVVSPRDAWSTRIAETLGRKGLPSQIARNSADLTQSDSDTSRDGRLLKLITALLLVGDPQDDAAWRAWCAFDDPLAASGQMTIASRLCRTHDLRLHELLASPALCEDIDQLMLPYQEAMGLIARTADMGRDALLRTLTDAFLGPDAPLPDAIVSLCAGTSPHDPASVVRQSILRRSLENHTWELTETTGDGPIPPSPSTLNDDAIRIGSMDRLCGLSPRLIIFSGFVNGFYPAHGLFDPAATPPAKVEQVKKDSAGKLGRAITKAREAVAFLAFTGIECSQAEELGIKIDRIGLQKRVRMARVSPSIFCEGLKG